MRNYWLFVFRISLFSKHFHFCWPFTWSYSCSAFVNIIEPIIISTTDINNICLRSYKGGCQTIIIANVFPNWQALRQFGSVDQSCHNTTTFARFICLLRYFSFLWRYILLSNFNMLKILIRFYANTVIPQYIGLFQWCCSMWCNISLQDDWIVI